MKRYSVGQIGPYWIGPVVRDDGELVKYEEASRILAQRDRLAGLLRRTTDPSGFDTIQWDWWKSNRDAVLAELDKEKQS